MPTPREAHDLVALEAVACVWLARRPPLDEQALIEAEVANSWLFLKEAVTATLSSVERRK
jgi:hypothetical protein